MKRKTMIEQIETINCTSYIYKSTPNDEIHLQCRICLKMINKQEYVEYCQCKGTCSKVHQKCLLTQIQTYKINEENDQLFTFCPLCKSRIILKKKRVLVWKAIGQGCSQVFCHQNIMERFKNTFLVFLIIILCFIEGLLVGAYSQLDQQNLSTFFIFILGLNSVILFITTIYVILSILITIRFQVTGVSGILISQVDITQKYGISTDEDINT